MKNIRICLFALLCIAAVSLNAQPVISTVSPLSGNPGSSVTITGSGFNTTAANNIVYFGATKAAVTAAGATSLTATVPLGATYMPVSVDNTSSNLTGYSQYPFLPTFNNSGYIAGNVNFNPYVDFATGNNPFGMITADFDGDGKPDVAVTNYTDGTVSIYRNLAASGVISSGTLATKVDFTVGSNPRYLAAADIDGDGKLDLIVGNGGSNTISLLRNTATSGSITTGSFAAKVDFTAGSVPEGIAIGDIDGDGRPDVVVNSNGSLVSVFHNTSTSGTITSSSLAAKVDFTTGAGLAGVAMADIDGDGKIDIITGNTTSETISVLRNVSSAGTINTSSFATKVDFPAGSNPYDVKAGDIDGDGKPDIIVANDNDNTVSIFRNTATSGVINTSSLAARVDFTAGSHPGNVALGDIDGDGKTDIVVANEFGSSISVFRNTAISGTISSSSLAAKRDFNTIASPVFIAICDMDQNGTPEILATSFGTVDSICILRNDPLPAPPSITSITPSAANPGASVTITGTGFNTTAANNIVYFGATKATITAASTTSLTATVPVDATFGPISVYNTSSTLTGYSLGMFLPTYNNSAYVAGTVNFDSKFDFTAGNGPAGVVVADIDGDGKSDMLVMNTVGNSISILRNTSSSGSIGSSSFAAKVDFTTGSTPDQVLTGDIDGDGKPDMIVVNAVSNTLSIFRNISSSGSITSGSFSTKVDFSTGTTPDAVAIGDLDGDGKADIALVNAGSNTVSVYRSTATSGSITTSSLAAKVDFTTGSAPGFVTIADIDGDGKQDIEVLNSTANTISVLRNTSTPGSITSASFSAKVDFATGGTGVSHAVADVDGDGKLDIVVANYTANTVSVLRNAATAGSINTSSLAAKVDFATGSTAYLVALSDIDGNGKPDIVVTNKVSNTVSVLRNTATSGSITSSSFAAKADYATGNGPISLAVGDMDGDGKPDLVIGERNDNTVSVLRNHPLATILGTATICVSATITLSDSTTGGTWSSGNTSVATVGSSTGIVTGIAGGTATISYNVTGGSATTTVTVTTALPVITSVTPLVGYPASSVTITGTGFNTTAANDVVYFGATRATVSSASATSLSVSVPADATYMPISVDNIGCGNLTGYSLYPFLPTYNNSAYLSGNINLDPKVDISTGAAPSFNAMGDIDGDGKLDIVVANENSATISVYRNISTTGTVGSGSFAAKVDFTTGTTPTGVVIEDMDGDGKPDIVVANTNSNTISVFRNTASSGSITSGSLASKVDFTTNAKPYNISVADADGDGKADIILAYQTTNTVSVYHNTATSGTINSSSFAAKVDFTTGSSPLGLAISDIDGDGKIDIIIANQGESSVSVLRNTSTAGVINSSSFAAKVDFTTASSPGMLVGDIDGDGKPDLVTGSGSTLSIYRNTATSGSISSSSFASAVNFSALSSVNPAALGDMDGDGKLDIIASGAGTASVYHNTATSGSITTSSLSAHVEYATGSAPYGFAVGDIDGDGKPDLAITNELSNTLSLYRNDPVSPLGTFTLCTGATATLIDSATGGTWSSSNTSVATVGASTGVVTGIAGGTAIISYTVTGGSATTIVTVAGTPVITSVSPIVATAGTSVTITGSGFNTTTPSNNIVYFGATRATVSSASSTSLTVSVPSDAIYAPVTVDNIGCGHLTGYSPYPFLPTYDNSGYISSIVNFDANVNFSAGTTANGTAIGDIDGDGKADMVVANWGANTVSVYRNISSSGSITTGSFASQVTFATGSHPESVTLADFDGDGKLDIVTANEGSASISVLRNTAASGSITTGSFAGKVDFGATGSPFTVVTGDIDGDGRTDIAVADAGTGVNTVSVFRNTATPGTINSGSFASVVNFTTGTYAQGIAIGDIDGDGKPELAVTDDIGNTVSVFRNTATPGTINSGSFATKVDFATGTAPNGAAIGDIDGDGKADLLVMNGDGNVTVFRNTATSGSINSGSLATGVNFAAGGGNYTLCLADVNGDGKADVITSGSNIVSVLRNTSTSGSVTSGSFASSVSFGTATGPFIVSAGDLDGDGKADIIVACGTSGVVSVLRNDPISSITGGTTLCAGATTTLNDVSTGGTWSSGNTAIATVGSSTGIVTGVAAGTATISYIVAGGSATTIVTVTSALPVITSVSPLVGYPASSVTLTGSGFNGTTSNNIVYFGATRATVTAATTTSLTVTVPTGATYMPVTVDNTGCANLTGYSPFSFLPTFNNSAYLAGIINFDGNVDFTAGTNPFDVQIGDIDGDGKPDLVVANVGGSTISVYRNTSTTGAVTSGSFATKVDFTAGTNPRHIALSDVDGDGKLDVVATNYSSNTVSIFRNTATSGTINSSSLAAKVDFPVTNLPENVNLRDLDGDGKPEMIVANYNGNTISVYRNTSSVGTITTGSFASRVDFTTGAHPIGIAIGDIDGDGKPDIAVTDFTAFTVSVFRNTTTTGTINSSSFAAKVDFAISSAGGARGIAIDDIDGDGKPDITVGSDGGTISVLRNTASSGSITSSSLASTVVFTTDASGDATMAIGDMDGDGKPDVVISNDGSTVNFVSVLRNTSTSGSITSSSFAAGKDFTTGTGPFGVAVGDLDGDGKPELVTTNYFANTISILRNNPLAAITTTLTAICAGATTTFSDATTGGTWSSSNTAIATVSSSTGVVTGVAAGTATISYNVAGGSATTTITINSILPVITSVSPLIGYPASSVTITGTGFSATTANDVVYFGATRATVTAATTTSLTVTVPTGATYMPVSVDNTGCSSLTGYSLLPFLPSFDNSAYAPGTVNFDPKTDFTTGSSPYGVAVGDIDGDGKPDMVVTNNGASSISVYRNTSTSGSVTSGSFGSAITFTTASQPANPHIVDIDGDGKLDIVLTNAGPGTVSVFRNTATSGAITTSSLASRADFTAGGAAYDVAIADFDGDGKPDMATSNTGPGTMSFFHNTSSVGSVSFSSASNITGFGSIYYIAAADFDGDGKPDIAVADQSSHNVSVLRNIASSGSLTSGSFAAKVNFSTGAGGPNGVLAADIDGDGKLDIVTGSGGGVSIFRNTATSGSVTSGSFATKVDFATGGSTFTIAAGDFDGDGKVDIIASNSDVNTVSVLRNTATSGSITSSSMAAYTDFATATNPHGIAAADMDGDGKADIVVTDIGSNSVSVIRNNPSTVVITGTTTVCQGATTTLSSATTGGTWSSSNTAIATVGSSTGIVTGVAAGTATISYTVSGTPTTIVVTVNATPSLSSSLSGAICSGSTFSYSPASTTSGTTFTWSRAVVTGISNLAGSGTGSVSEILNNTTTSPVAVTYVYTLTADGCANAQNVVVTANPVPVLTSALSATACSGTVFSYSPATATVGTTFSWSRAAVTGISNLAGSGTGAVSETLNNTTSSPVAVTYAYTLTASGCANVQNVIVTVNPLSSTGAITGAATVCAGSTTTFGDTASGGTWSSSNTAIATVGSASGIVSGIAAGTARITYTVSGSCGSAFTTQVITVNALPTAFTVTGGGSSCGSSVAVGLSGSTSGILYQLYLSGSPLGSPHTGTGSSFSFGSYSVAGVYTVSAANATTGCSRDMTGSATITTGTVADAGTITGSSTVCTGSTTTLSDTTTGGTWSSSATAKATVGSASGIVTGLAAGTATISYTVTNSCGTARATFVITVNSSPSAGTITGSATVCAGSTLTLTNATTGGVWGSSNANASAGSTGIVTGVAAGTSMISYTVTNSCGSASATKTITINPLASAGSITGTATVATGATTTLSDAVTGGTWHSSTTSVATVSAAGVVTGVAAGTAIISYTVTNSCGSAVATTVVTVNPSFSTGITGTLEICSGTTATLSDATTGGVWHSSTTSVATINSSGVVTGISAGTATISYTYSGSMVTAIVTVDPSPAAITGGTSVCLGLDTTLSDATTGGTWLSNNSSIASIGSSSGIVSGIATGTTTISYVLSTGCYKTISMTVKPLPATISGAPAVCIGSSTTLTDATSGGLSWTSSNTSVATVGSTSGSVTGVSAGTATITYLVSTGCITTKTISVNTLPPAITGVSSVCAGSTALFTDATTGGTWSSSSAMATAGSSTGLVTGITAGSVKITYTLSTGCFVTSPLTVNALPSAITGTAVLCVGSTTALGDVTTGGIWSSATGSVATVGSAGIVSGISTGTETISYASATTGCAATKVVTVNSAVAGITGSGSVCTGATTALSTTATGGTWSSGATGVATISSSGVATGVAAGTATITYTVSAGCKTNTVITVNASPAAISGATAVCIGSATTFTDATTSGTWTSSNTGLATVDPSTGTITGVAAGTATITYTVSTGCYKTKNITVSSLPAAIGGASVVCIGNTTTLTDATGGSSWSSSNTSVATIGSTSGIVTGISAGTSVITYTATTGCMTTKTMSVSSLPSAITGTVGVCAGSATSLSDATSGGTWSSSNTTKATVGSTGIVTGVAAGTANITYSLGTGCNSISVVTVNAVPSAITGTATLCVGSTTALSDVTTGGTWSSAFTSVATAGSTGIISGISAGTAIISYTTATAGCTATKIVTVSSSAIGITGTTGICAGTTSALSTTGTGGVWSSGATGVATVSGAGVVTGISAGTATITYAVSGGCNAVTVVTVSATPPAISGAASVCTGSTTTFTDATTGGTWTSSDATLASVDASSGVVTGITAGTATITYATGSGCFTTKSITVSAGPAAISGTSSLCVGSSATLSDATPGSSWSSSNTSVATIGITSGIVTGAGTGTSIITYTAATGCITTTIISINALPSAITGASSVCAGSAAALTDASTGGTWSSSATGIAAVDSTGIVTGITSGIVNITYSQGVGCNVTASVTVNALPSAITGIATLCVGSTTALSDATTGGVWSSATGSVATVGSAGIVSGISTGTETISYASATTGCASTKVVTVNAAVAAITGTTGLCAGATSTLSTTATGGTWSSGDVTVATISGTGVVTGIAAGTTTITYTASAGCNAVTVVTVSDTPPAISGAVSVCAGSATTFTDATTGGTWTSSDATLASVDASTGVVTGVAAGTATITYTIGSGCVRAKNITVSAGPAAISGTSSLCVGSSATLSDATPGSSWSSSNTSVANIGITSGIVTGAGTGTSIITYTATTGCIATTIISINALPSAITGASSVCAGSAAALTDASTGGTWSSSATGIASVDSTGIVTGITSGIVNITYSQGVGCNVTASVTVNALPSAITGIATLCVGSTTALSDATTGGVWNSATGSVATVGSAGIVSGISTGTETISYASATTGCASTKVVTVNAAVAAITGTTGLCAGSTSTLSTTATGGTWSSGDATVATISGTGVVTGVSAGTATITYTVSAGCNTTTVVTVSAVPPAISGATSVCAGAATTFTDAATGGTWSSSNTSLASVDPSGGVVTGIAAGTATITYSVSSGCYKTKSITVSPAPAAISGAASVCIGATATYTDVTSGGISWTSSNTSVATIGSTSGVASGISAGTATITYLVSTGCAVTKTISVNPLPAAITGTMNTCVGSATTLSDADAGGTWTSSIATTASVGSATGIVTGITAGTVNITYSLGGCIRTTGLTVNPVPATITGVMALCTASTTTLNTTTTGGTWSSSATGIATVGTTGIVTGITAGTATISYTLTTGCARTAIVTVSAAPVITGTTSICMGSSVTLSASGSGGTWSSSATSVATVGASTGVVTGVSTGTSAITYTISASCKANAVVTVNAGPAAITGPSGVCNGYSATMADATTGGTWSSSNVSLATIDPSTGIVSGISSGTVIITYTISSGCYATRSLIVGSGMGAVTGTANICAGSATTFVSTSPSTGESWMSSNTAIATVGVTSGVVTGVSSGTATITFTPYSFSPFAGCVSTRIVTVDAMPSVAAVSGPASVITGHTISLTDATAGGTWSSSNTARASVDASGTVTGLSVMGTVTISYTVTSGACHTPATKLITVTASRPGSPVENSGGEDGTLLVYPNPTSGAFTVKASLPGIFTIYTLEGKELQRTPVTEGLNTLSLPKNTAAGIYMCRFSGENGATVMIRLVYEQ